MKAGSDVFAGFVSVFCAALVIAATWCLYVEVAQAACSPAACQANCYPTAGRKCTSGSGAVCSNSKETCNTCACPANTDANGACNCYAG
jgi:hypothetical protein